MIDCDHKFTHQGECFHGNNNKKQRQDSSNEKFTPRSRCFVSNITAMVSKINPYAAGG